MIEGEENIRLLNRFAWQSPVKLGAVVEAAEACLVAHKTARVDPAEAMPYCDYAFGMLKPMRALADALDALDKEEG